MLLSAATVRRPAVALGALLLALTLSGPAWGQTIVGAGSVVGATTESLAPVTKAVTGTASKAVEPVAKAAAKATRPAKTQASAPAKTSRPAKAQASTPAKTSKTSSPATKAVTRPTRPAASRPAASRVDTVASRATRSVEPLAAAATRSVTDMLRTATAVLPSETQALLGPLVEAIDGQAEELTGSLLASATISLSGTVSALTGALVPAQGSSQSSFQIWDGGGSSGYAQAEEPVPALSGTSARTRASGGMPPMPDRGAALATPPYPAAPPPAAISQGARLAGESSSPGAPPASPQPNAPASPASALGSSTGFSAAFAVLAGLVALALSALVGRLLPWSDTIRPLAFVLPPERPG